MKCIYQALAQMSSPVASHTSAFVTPGSKERNTHYKLPGIAGSRFPIANYNLSYPEKTFDHRFKILFL